jgi:hypothetical protein
MADDWNPDLVSVYELAWYDRCCLRSYEVVHSKHYQRPTDILSHCYRAVLRAATSR